MTAIATAVRKLAGVDGMSRAGLIVGTVSAVSENDRTCDVTTISNSGEVDLLGVNLMAETDDGLLYLPAIESTVIIASSEKVNYFVVMFSELQKIVQIVGDSGIEVTSDLIKFNKGDYGGLVKVIQLTERLNKVETALADLISKYNTHVHTGVTTGGGASGTTPTVSTQVVTNTEQTYIENKIVTHGSSI